jgi:hypothetical protein
MPAPTISPLPTPPSRSTDPANFAIEADAFVAALPEFQTDANAQADYLDDLAAAVDADAVAAAASAAAALVSENNAAASEAGAASAADVSLWVSGTTYAIGDCVFSPIDFETYRRKTNGAGTTDPSLDATNWSSLTKEVYPAAGIAVSTGTAWDSSLTAPSGALVGTTASQELTNKTLTGPVVNASRSAVNAVAASAINCSLGNYFTKTASGALSWTVTNVPATGAFIFLLELTNGGTGTQTWFTGTKWPAGTAPTLTTSGVDLLGFITDDGGTNWRGVAIMLDSK